MEKLESALNEILKTGKGNSILLELDAELYFVRCSRFKRKDKVPIISAQDESYLRGFAEKIVLVFDEDVARGETLRSLVERLRPHFRRTLSASVIKHYLAPFSPDFVGKENYD